MVMTNTQNTKRSIAPYARAFIVALVLALVALVFLTAELAQGAAIFGFGALAVAIVGGIMALTGVTNRDA